MKSILLYIITLFSFIINVSAQDKQPYSLFDKDGKKVEYTKMLKEILQNDVLLFGEYHNNAISHWLQLELTKDCQQKRNIVMGAEMFEHDNQDAVDNYVKGNTTARIFATQARFWDNYNTDYAPLINFAKEKNISFAATNIPRNYASAVSKTGFIALDSISETERKLIAPLPIKYDATLPGYKNMMAMMGDHGSENMPKAQAIKDATMAHFILQYSKPDHLFIHYNGSYHSDNFDGIYWYLKQQRPNIKIATISTVTQTDISSLLEENKNKADFIICVDEDMTSTF